MDTLNIERMLLAQVTPYNHDKRDEIKEELNKLIQDDLDRRRVEEKTEDDLVSAVILLNNK